MPTKIEFKVSAFDLKKFAQDSYAYRSENGFTRQNLADIVGCTLHLINSYETKDILPRLDIFFNVCDLMGKDVRGYFK